MRIGLDLSCLEGARMTGVETYALRLAQFLPAALEPARLVVLSRTPLAESLADRVEVSTRSAWLPRSIWRRLALPRLAVRCSLDLLHVPVAHAPRVPGVVVTRTIHDVDRDHAGTMRALRTALPTVAVSQATKDDIVARYPDQGAPIRVIHHGVDARFFAAEPRPVAPPYALVVGTVRARRCPDVVAGAVERVRRTHPSFELRWIGAGPTGPSPIHYLGWRDDATVVDALRGARALLCPSEREGFGLPLLEGLAAGVPVIAADTPVAREVGGGHLRRYPARDVEALAGAFLAVLAAPPSPAALAAGRAHATQFSWECSARAHAAFFRELLEAPGRRRRAAPSGSDG